MIREHRKHRRYPVALECQWEGSSSYAPARISDIGLGGCYVDSRSVPSVGHTVDLEVTFSDVPVTLRGMVTQAQAGMGFGIQFADLDTSAIEQLEAFLASMPEQG